MGVKKSEFGCVAAPPTRDAPFTLIMILSLLIVWRVVWRNKVGYTVAAEVLGPLLRPGDALFAVGLSLRDSDPKKYFPL